MARLITRCRGNRGGVHRLSSSTAECSVESWNSGVEVYADVKKDGTVDYYIYETGGSYGSTGKKLIHKFNGKG